MASSSLDRSGVAKRILAWHRVWPACALAICVSAALKMYFHQPLVYPFSISILAALMGVIAFGLTEFWPVRLPAKVPRWVLQALMVAFVVPFATPFLFYAHRLYEPTTAIGDPHLLMFAGILLGPWAALAARYRDVSGQAQQLRLSIELERSEFERQGLHARMKVLQAQVEPHFLFNTLANIQELVETGSSRSPAVLESLIAYLQAAVPRVNDPQRTVADELELARLYLSVMHMRIPDRLEFSISSDAAIDSWRCPAMAVLTLVENAVRHGIDPSERGGSITVRAWQDRGDCHIRVTDTGVGITESRRGMGTGLDNLRERLLVEFGESSRVWIEPNLPHGAIAELAFPSGPRE